MDENRPAGRLSKNDPIRQTALTLSVTVWMSGRQWQLKGRLLEPSMAGDLCGELLRLGRTEVDWSLMMGRVLSEKPPAATYTPEICGILLPGFPASGTTETVAAVQVLRDTLYAVGLLCGLLSLRSRLGLSHMLIRATPGPSSDVAAVAAPPHRGQTALARSVGEYFGMT